MARPASDVRSSVRAAVRNQVAGTWKDFGALLGASGVINPQAPSELRIVRKTLNEMLRWSEVTRGPLVRVPGVNRPMRVFQPAALHNDDTTTTLTQAMRAWR